MQVALASSLIFRIVDAEAEDSTGDTAFYGKNGVAWVLRFGGVCTMVSFFSFSLREGTTLKPRSSERS